MFLNFDYWKFQIFQMVVFAIFVYRTAKWFDTETDGLMSRIFEALRARIGRKRR